MFARIILDTSDYESGLDEASKNTSNFADKLKTGLATAAKVGAAALTAAATGVAALTKASIDQYAEYEQLVGGVDTLFKDASDTIQQYAANAYKTAGVSANSYMQQATAFSASLIQSLGGDTEAAAEYANQAIMDMSDNANKMGTDIESIQQTYQSLMRGNYAMLDNLKLGYGGTKSELERLVADAEKLTGQALDPAKFSDVITAIHAVQENLGITGTTAEEAATTIEGSVGMMKAAWSNLMTGIADENADLDTLISQFVTSAETAAGNIIPRVTQILSGMGSAIEQLAPILAAEVPGLITSVLPSLVSAGAQLLVGLVTGLVSAVPQLVAAVPQIVTEIGTALANLLPQVLDMGVQLLDQLTTGIETGLPDMVSRLPQIIKQFLTFITDSLPDILDQGAEMLNSLVNGIIDSIPVLVSNLPQIITSFTKFIANNLPKIAETGVSIIANLVVGIIKNIPAIVKALPQIISAIVDGIGDLMESVVEIGVDIVEGIWEGIKSMAGWIGDKVGGFFGGIVDGVKDFLGIHSPSTVFRDEVGKNIGLGIAAGLDDSKDDAVKAANDLAKSVYDKSVDWLDKQTKYQNFSLQQQLEVWEAIQGQFIKESQQYADAEEKIFDLRKQIQEEYYDKVQEITTNISDLEQNYQNELSKRTQEIFNSFGLFDQIPERQKVAGDELLENLSGQIAAMEDFYSGLDELMSRGVGSALVDEIRSMGPDAADELSALLSLSDEKLSEYASLYQEKQELANSIAVNELEELRKETDTQIQKNLQSLEELYNKNAPTVGKAFTDGLSSGIMSGLSSVVNSAVNVAQAAVKATRDALGIHPPSRVFSDIGKNMALGLGEGWDSEFSRIKGDIEGGMDFGTASVDFASSGLGVSSAGIVNGFAAAAQQSGGSYTLNLVLPTGERLASYFFDPLVSYAKANGTPIVNPTG